MLNVTREFLMHESTGPDAHQISRPDPILDTEFAKLLVDSYQRLVGRAMVDEEAGERPTASWLYRDAPFCLLAHEGGTDPRFIYANAAAQACFGYSWDEFTRLPSRLSAEAPDRSERQRLLDVVARDSFIDDYRGIRVAKSGRRFWIERAAVWELIDEFDFRHGQAAMFRTWRDVES
jgi:hypothetical protein